MAKTNTKDVLLGIVYTTILVFAFIAVTEKNLKTCSNTSNTDDADTTSVSTSEYGQDYNYDNSSRSNVEEVGRREVRARLYHLIRTSQGLKWKSNKFITIEIVFYSDGSAKDTNGRPVRLSTLDDYEYEISVDNCTICAFNCELEILGPF